MDMELTIKKMKENEKNFYPLIEGMKRRADKGLIQGYTGKDIDDIVAKIEKESTNDTKESNSLNQEIFEINEAIEKFDYLDVENYSEDLLESIILFNFMSDVYRLDSTSLNEGPIWDGIKKVGSSIAKGAVTAWDGVKKAATFVGDGIVKGAKAVGGFFANPYTWGGAGLALGTVGAVSLIKHLRKKRKERNLTENISSDILFSTGFESTVKNILSQLSEAEISALKENCCEDTLEIISMFPKESVVLGEAVTYIDNAGNLKTKLTADYVKDQHLYDTKTQIEKYEKNRKKKKDYKLISESIDIDSIKKLSEMSIEDILSEEF